MIKTARTMTPEPDSERIRRGPGIDNKANITSRAHQRCPKEVIDIARQISEGAQLSVISCADRSMNTDDVSNVRSETDRRRFGKSESKR